MKQFKSNFRGLACALTSSALLLGPCAFGPTGSAFAWAQTTAAVHTLPTETVSATANAAKEINEFWEADRKQMPPQSAVL